MAVTCGVMGELFVVERTAWHVNGVGLNKEVIEAGFSVYGIEYIPSD